MKINKEISDQLNKIPFKKFKNIKIGTSAEIVVLNKYTDVSKLIIGIIYNCFFNKFKISIPKDTKHIFYYSPEYMNRKEHYIWFESLANNVSGGYIVISSQKKFDFNVKKIISVFNWFYQLRTINISLNNKLAILINLLIAYDSVTLIEKYIKGNNLISVTTVCDVHMIDSIIVQYYNNKNIDTISLQHGLYSRLNPISMKNSMSKYLLVYGKATEQECLKLGMDAKKIIRVGMPKLLYCNLCNKIVEKEIKTIGIIFDGSQYIDNDIKMLKTVMNIINEQNLNIKIKLHPGTPIKNYSDLYFIEKNYLVYYDEILTEDFFDEVDLIVCSGSTVYIESLIKLKPVLLFKSDKPDVFPKINWCAFHDSKELNMLIEFMKRDLNTFENTMKETRSYLTETNDVRKNYIEFYKSLERVKV